MPHLSKKFYAGIGSRKTPKDICDYMTVTARKLQYFSYTLRSGGAFGADTAFENGCNNKVIYIPWQHYNDKISSDYKQLSPEAFKIAEQNHPIWNRLSTAAKKLMARNVYQVLGDDLQTKSEFVLCWTPDGCETAKDYNQQTGGTGLAISVASNYGIPVYNLKNANAIKRLNKVHKLNLDLLPEKEHQLSDFF